MKNPKCHHEFEYWNNLDLMICKNCYIARTLTALERHGLNDRCPDEAHIKTPIHTDDPSSFLMQSPGL